MPAAKQAFDQALPIKFTTMLHFLRMGTGRYDPLESQTDVLWSVGGI